MSEKQRMEYWQETASRLFLGLRTEQKRRDEPFFGRLDHRETGSLSVTHLHSASQRVYRTEKEISRAPRECFFICMQLEGVCTVKQPRGREYQTRPGDVELLDGVRPGELSFDTAYRRVVILVPYAALRPRLVDPDKSIGSVLRASEGTGALVSAYVHAFAHNQVTEPAAGSLSDILVSLLAVGFNTMEDGARPDAASVREARRHAIRDYAERNLSDPALSPATVAAHFHCSTRYLHGLFAEAGESFMRWVLARRLARCRQALLDPALRERNIADIAFRWGFQDLSHFGRAFKAAFGMTPRECRAEVGGFRGASKSRRRPLRH
ncbi:helix-turn-helix domain-containing protein [Pyxidicoccus parkwayensis]|uniref:Helix-turn-helix domain-containing protein n=1 Tax=Pyxidicoccus parkwayensis TaxID=2813578 RepID=A0ABX7NUL7_9BACT|nr:helix-turn-helix domain-containing protein [Pyxidicoccus parkwaysis]QSQ22616.1 helix-turn-helix domain-containing protein [Pyxidicoccus parkwaysis]